MKKILKVTKLNKLSKDVTNSLVVAYRSNNKIYIQNMNVDTRWNEKTSELSLVFKLNEGDVLYSGDSEGIANKRSFDA